MRITLHLGPPPFDRVLLKILPDDKGCGLWLQRTDRSRAKDIVLAKFFFNLRHQGRTVWTIPAVCVAVLVALAVAIRPDTEPAGTGSATVSFSDVAPIVEQRCATCHSETPTQEGFSTAPAGVMLETAEQIAARADDIERVVSSKAMPLGNVTGMTAEERDVVVAWVAQGASTAAER